MEKVLKIFSVIILASMLVFACDKEKGSIDKVPDVVAVAISVLGTNGELEPAMLFGTRQEIEKSLSSENGYSTLLKVSSRNNLYTIDRRPPGNTTPNTPGGGGGDPSTTCIKEFDNYFNKARPSMLIEANRKCFSISKTFVCPMALKDGTDVSVSRTYTVLPDDPKCGPKKQIDGAKFFKFLSFNFTKNQFDSESLGKFIIANQEGFD